MFTLNNYALHEQVYAGRNTLVYRALRLSDGKTVILKILNDSYPSPERIAWFRREYEITQSLDLPGVVAAYALEYNQQRWLMVLEDFGGESLSRLHSAGQIELVTLLRLARDVSAILGQIHQRRVIHKDINPSNILYNPATGQVKLIDFGISTVLSHEESTFRNPNALEGTLAYMSPEQTGRMNRAMDYRTDFYSLGVTLYELLTGRLPFQSSDVLELIHRHLAQQPPVPHALRSGIPPMLSTLILKLMAKNAEARYQSAYGLQADLEECLCQMEESAWIAPFPLRRRDVADRLLTPQRLYGREQERAEVHGAFERASRGASELLLVAGAAGAGKSALVQEVYRPITRQRGYFINGKFEQFQRNIPYAALIQAFQELLRHLLSESAEVLALWRERLATALAPNAQVLIDVLPDLERILGPQPPAPALASVEAQNRFNLLFRRFVQLFAQPEHPLVLFVDDLQWADAASLVLLEQLLTAPERHHLLVVGAYRDTEVGPSHLLRLMLNTFNQAGTVVRQLKLGPLEDSAVASLLADTLHTSAEQVAPLAELLNAKTGGNPFFLHEFLRLLANEGLLRFDYEQGSWQWDIAAIRTRRITENVVELMINRVQQAPPTTQETLKLAACIGSRFDLATLALVAEQLPVATAQHLQAALERGLIEPRNDAYKLMTLDVPGLSDEVNAAYVFSHDRVQQAAYTLIPETERPALHWRIGQLLREMTTNDEPRTRSDASAGSVQRSAFSVPWKSASSISPIT